MTMPTRRFDNDDQAAQHWLTVLRDGDPDQKIHAREQLAAIFERKGMFEEAADLLSANVRDGVRNADIFRWLARLYRAQGDEVTAMQAAAEAAKYMQPSRPPVDVRPAAPTYAPPVEPSRPTRAVGAQPPPAAAKARPWYLRTPVLILASVLCLPPATFYFIWTQRWRPALKIVMSIPLGIWTLIWAASVMGGMARPAAPPSSASTSSTQAPAAQVAVVKPEPTPRPPTATPAPPTATPLPPTATPRPDPAQAQYLDPRELVADPKAYQGKNVLLQGKALNVTHNAEEKGIFSDTPDHTWMQVMAAVRGRSTTESVVVEFYPRDPKILKDECYRILGIVQGTTKVRRTLTGAEDEVPIIKGYSWQGAPANQFGTCQAP